MSGREAKISGLRKLADLLEQHPDLPVPYEVGNHMTFQLLEDGDESATKMARIRSLIGGEFRKNTYGGSGTYFELCGHLDGVPISIVTFRENVCERVVVGAREVTEEVPDPELVAGVPTITVTKTVEDIEWRCAPVLSGEPS